MALKNNSDSTLDTIGRIQAKTKHVTLNPSNIGERIKQIRKKAKLSQGEFYLALDGIAQNGQGQVSKWENGTMPNIEILVKIAAAGGVSLQWLLYGDANETPTENISTWRDFCRILSDMRYSMELSIKLDNHFLHSIDDEHKNAMCHISFPIAQWQHRTVIDGVNPDIDKWEFITTTAGHYLTPFLVTLEKVTALHNSPSFGEFETQILHTALEKVPNSPPSGKFLWGDEQIPF